jgi:hypothetical protein
MEKTEVAQLAVNFGLVSKYTSLVAVEERDEIVEGKKRKEKKNDFK